jgi:oxygen-independent coproporphyrinogen-3 oxidase
VPLGIYISIPFCKAKCSFCNFSSGVCAEIAASRAYTEKLGAELPAFADSVYFGGGTPSLLPPALIQKLLRSLRSHLPVATNAEITVECAPGQLSDESLEAFQREGMNRLSFGVQSFVDQECAAVGRLHTGAECLAELKRVAEAGVKRVGLDLIVGLPHQTAESWRFTVDQALASGVEHISLYMLEVDEDSRLGREALAGGTRYGAAALPDEDRIADWYQAACAWLEAGGVHQYEISNFARPGGQSRHNRKYWERAPYLGFGMDAHSMLPIGAGAVRWANADSMAAYADRLGAFERTLDRIGQREAFEESLFLGLRLLEGIDLDRLNATCAAEISDSLAELAMADLISSDKSRVRLTAKGRMISNEVFERLLLVSA